MASNYKQNGLDIDSLACNYGTSSSPSVNFSNQYTGFGTYSYKSSADSGNAGIQAFTCNYKINGTSYNLIKRGGFPAWGTAFVDLTTSGDYTLETDGSTYLRIKNSSGTVLHNLGPSNFKDSVIPKYIIAEIQGAGGGGGGADAWTVGHGGGSGSYAQVVIELPTKLEIRVGAGGTAGAKGANAGGNGGASWVQDYRWTGDSFTGYLFASSPGGSGGGGASNSGGSGGGTPSIYNVARSIAACRGASGGFNAAGSNISFTNSDSNKYYISLDTGYQSASAMYFQCNSSGAGSAGDGSGGGSTSRGYGGNGGNPGGAGSYGGGGGGGGDAWIVSSEAGGKGGDGFVRLWY